MVEGVVFARGLWHPLHRMQACWCRPREDGALTVHRHVSLTLDRHQRAFATGTWQPPV